MIQSKNDEIKQLQNDIDDKDILLIERQKIIDDRQKIIDDIPKISKKQYAKGYKKGRQDLIDQDTPDDSEEGGVGYD